MTLFVAIVTNVSLFPKTTLLFLQMLKSLTSVFIKALNWDLCLLVQRTKMESETMSTPHCKEPERGGRTVTNVSAPGDFLASFSSALLIPNIGVVPSPPS